MSELSNLIEEYLYINETYQIKILISVLIILILWGVRRVLIKIVLSKFDDISMQYQWRKVVTTATVVLAFLLLLREWLGVFGSIGTFLGLLSAGLAIAFKDPLVNIAGWVFIMIRKPLKVGERVEIDDVIGDVIDIRIFQFSLMEVGNWVDADQSTGRIIHVPNGKIFAAPQASYTEGFEYIWHEIPVLITFESDWQKAKRILSEIVSKHASANTAEAQAQIREAAKKFLIYYNKLSPIVYTTVKDSGVLLTMRYLSGARRRRTSEGLIWEDVLKEFAVQEDIDFAYPTRRFYNNMEEGKRLTKPAPAKQNAEREQQSEDTENKD